MDLGTLTGKINQYNNIRNNTKNYREEWHKTIKPMLKENLQKIINETGLDAEVEEKEEMGNLEAIVFSLGQENSGICQNIGKVERPLIRQNGMLVYQQLFNGKILIMVINPAIEGLGQPQPPKNIEILRPEELKATFLIRHVETLISDITAFEDYDDDEPKRIGFNVGFKNENVIQNPS